MVNIFLFAHQDDEFGVFSEITKLINAGEKILVFYLTSGSSVHYICEKRDFESVRVLNKLGVNTKDVIFLGTKLQIFDGKLVEKLEDVYSYLYNALLGINIKRMYFLAYEGGHQDHDAVFIVGTLISNKLAIKHSNVFQFSLYNSKGLPLSLYRVLCPIIDNGKIVRYKISFKNRLIYLKLILYYKSQIKAFIFLYPFILFHYLFKGTQTLQLVDPLRIRFRPHAGKLLYEKRNIFTYNNFKAKVDQFVVQLKNRCS